MPPTEGVLLKKSCCRKAPRPQPLGGGCRSPGTLCRGRPVGVGFQVEEIGGTQPADTTDEGTTCVLTLLGAEPKMPVKQPVL